MGTFHPPNSWRGVIRWIPARSSRRKRLVVLGGTGFLGKIFWVMLLSPLPGASATSTCSSARARSQDERSSASGARSRRARRSSRSASSYGDGFEAFLREKIVPIDGDVGLPHCGIDAALAQGAQGHDRRGRQRRRRRRLQPAARRGARHQRVRRAEPRRAREGARRRAAACTRSTCYVVGNRDGLDPRGDARRAFTRSRAPRSSGATLWDPEREIAECLDLIAQAQAAAARTRSARASSSRRATKNLDAPRRADASGAPLDARARRRVEAQVRRAIASSRRASSAPRTGAGRTSTRTRRASASRSSRARAAASRSCARRAARRTIEFPFPGWNEGISTSAPIIFLAMKGQHAAPRRRDAILDFIPADIVVRRHDPHARRAARGHARSPSTSTARAT